MYNNVSNLSKTNTIRLCVRRYASNKSFSWKMVCHDCIKQCILIRHRVCPCENTTSSIPWKLRFVRNGACRNYRLINILKWRPSYSCNCNYLNGTLCGVPLNDVCSTFKSTIRKRTLNVELLMGGSRRKAFYYCAVSNYSTISTII